MMKSFPAQFRLLCFLGIAPLFLWTAHAAEPSLPAAIDEGFKLLKTAGPGPAFDAWRQGGVLIEADASTQSMASANFAEMLKPFRTYQSFEVVRVTEIGQMSKLIYLSIRFDRGIVYGRFLIWQSDQNWVVQKMDFNPNPEVIMPWLTLANDPI